MTQLLPRPTNASQAVARALSLVDNGGEYQLGTGDYRPGVAFGGLVDVPWTYANDGVTRGSDCAGFAICWCYKIPRHRPGFNLRSHGIFDVSDDINCNSAIGDADTDGDLFERATTPAPGDLLTWPTITLKEHPGMSWCGHVAIVTGTSRMGAWDPRKPDYSRLDVAQCCGGNGRKPAVLATDGSMWSQHDHTWPNPEHRTVILRVKSAPLAVAAQAWVPLVNVPMLVPVQPPPPN